MTAAWVPAPVAGSVYRPRLTVVPGSVPVGRDRPDRRPPIRRVPVEVRRRRTLLAAMALLVVGLALPLAGTGGLSHATGSAPAGTGPATVTVQPGDTLWTIVERADPHADPRPLVTRLTAQLGTAVVVPGERIPLP